ncbi:MAG: carboxypeptidase regulatory-like domain-containing protein [Verrucomicrobia bacterium]|nr:carboxypeptidase regulatory-like domain-containing protein [Verrucomicrobiota bacterium]
MTVEEGTAWKVAVRETGDQRIRIYQFKPAIPSLRSVATIEAAGADRFIGLVPRLGGDLTVLAADSATGARITHSIRYTPTESGYSELRRDPIPFSTPWSLGANLLLLPGVPFVDENALPIARLKKGDWTEGLVLPSPPATATVVAESFRGAALGLGGATPQSVSLAPGVRGGLVNQYRANVSVFYWGASSVDPLPDVIAAPASGAFKPGLVVQLNTSPQTVAAGGQVLYRLGTGAWKTYDPARQVEPLSHTTTLFYYWRRADGVSGSIRQATYTILSGRSEPDCDRDGVPDFIEALHGLDPCASGPDSDHDGVTDLAELLQGTDPADPSSVNRDGALSRVRPERSLQLAFIPLSHGGGGDEPPQLLPSLAETAGAPTHITLRDLFGSRPERVSVLDPNPARAKEPSAVTRDFPASGDPNPSGVFAADDSSFNAGMLIAAAEDHFNLRNTDGTIRSAAGREVAAFCLPPASPPLSFAFERGAGADADEEARWRDQARAYYSGRAPLVLPTHLDFLTTTEVLLTEYIAGQLLFQRGALPSARLTLTPFRRSETTSPKNVTPVPAGALHALDVDLLKLLETSAGAGRPAYLLGDLQDFSHSLLADPVSPDARAIRRIAAEIYRVAALPPADPGPFLPSPLDALRSFFQGGSQHDPYLGSSLWRLSSVEVAAARTALANTLPAAPPHIEQVWQARLNGNYRTDECLTWAEDGTARNLTLVDDRGHPYPLGFGFDVPQGTHIRIRGYAAPLHECPGSAIMPTQVQLLDMPPGDDPEDTNHNGVPDSLERYYLGALVSGPDVDTDHDGVSDLEELRRGTDPREGSPGGSLGSVRRLNGVDLYPLGAATLTPTPAGILMDGLSSSGLDGVAAAIPGSDALSVEFVPDDATQGFNRSNAKLSILVYDDSGEKLADVEGIWTGSADYGFHVTPSFGVGADNRFQIHVDSDYASLRSDFPDLLPWSLWWNFWPKAVRAAVLDDGRIDVRVDSANGRRGAALRMYAGEDRAHESLAYPEAIHLLSAPGIARFGAKIGRLEIRLGSFRTPAADQRTLASASVENDGISYQGLGDAKVLTGPGFVELQGLGNTGNDGVRITGAGASRLAFDLDLPAAPGSEWVARVLGRRLLELDFAESFQTYLYASLRVAKVGSDWVAQPDFTTLGAGSVTLTALDQEGRPLPPGSASGVDLAWGAASAVSIVDSSSLSTPHVEAMVDSSGAFSWILRWEGAIPIRLSTDAAIAASGVSWTTRGGTSPLLWVRRGTDPITPPALLAPGRLRNLEILTRNLPSFELSGLINDASNPSPAAQIAGFRYTAEGDALLLTDPIGRVKVVNMTSTKRDGFRVHLDGHNQVQVNLGPAIRDSGAISLRLIDTEGQDLGTLNSRNDASEPTWEVCCVSYNSDWSSFSLLGSGFNLVVHQTGAPDQTFPMNTIRGSVGGRSTSIFSVRYPPTSWAIQLRDDGSLAITLGTENIPGLIGGKPATYLNLTDGAGTFHPLYPHHIDLITPPKPEWAGKRLGAAIFLFESQPPQDLEGDRLSLGAGVLTGLGQTRLESLLTGVRLSPLLDSETDGVFWPLGAASVARASMSLAPSLMPTGMVRVTFQMFDASAFPAPNPLLSMLSLAPLPGGSAFGLQAAFPALKLTQQSIQARQGSTLISDQPAAAGAPPLPFHLPSPQPPPVPGSQPSLADGGNGGSNPSDALPSKITAQILANGAVSITAEWRTLIVLQMPDGVEVSANAVSWTGLGSPFITPRPLSLAVHGSGLQQLDLTDLTTEGQVTAGFAIRGTVRDRQSQPLNGIKVRLSGPVQIQTQTDQGGHYTFDNLAINGPYFVSAIGVNRFFFPAQSRIQLPVSDVTVDFVEAPDPSVPPGLSIVLDGNDILLKWAASPAGYVLESADHLGNNATQWSAVAIGAGETQRRVTVDGRQRFYRLRNP